MIASVWLGVAADTTAGNVFGAVDAIVLGAIFVYTPIAMPILLAIPERQMISNTGDHP